MDTGAAAAQQLATLTPEQLDYFTQYQQAQDAAIAASAVAQQQQQQQQQPSMQQLLHHGSHQDALALQQQQLQQQPPANGHMHHQMQRHQLSALLDGSLLPPGVGGGPSDGGDDDAALPQHHQQSLTDMENMTDVLAAALGAAQQQQHQQLQVGLDGSVVDMSHHHHHLHHHQLPDEDTDAAHELLATELALHAAAMAPAGGRLPRARRGRANSNASDLGVDGGEGKWTGVAPYVPPNPPGRLLSLPSTEAAAIFGAFDKFPIKGLVAFVEVDGHPLTEVHKSNVTKRVVKSGTGEAYRYRIYLPRCPQMEKFGDQPLHITHVRELVDRALHLNATVAGSRAEYKAWRTVKVNNEGVWRVRHPSGRSRAENDIRGPDATKPRCYQLSLPYSFMQLAFPGIIYPNSLDVQAVVNGELRPEVTRCTVTSHKASRNNPGPQIALGKANRLLAPYWGEKHVQLYGYQAAGPGSLHVWLDVEGDGEEGGIGSTEAAQQLAQQHMEQQDHMEQQMHHGGDPLAGQGLVGQVGLAGQVDMEHLMGLGQDGGAVAMLAAIIAVQQGGGAGGGDAASGPAETAMRAAMLAVQQQHMLLHQQQQRDGGVNGSGGYGQGALGDASGSGLDHQAAALLYGAQLGTVPDYPGDTGDDNGDTGKGSSSLYKPSEELSGGFVGVDGQYSLNLNGGDGRQYASHHHHGHYGGSEAGRHSDHYGLDGRPFSLDGRGGNVPGLLSLATEAEGMSDGRDDAGSNGGIGAGLGDGGGAGPSGWGAVEGEDVLGRQGDGGGEGRYGGVKRQRGSGDGGGGGGGGEGVSGDADEEGRRAVADAEAVAAASYALVQQGYMAAVDGGYGGVGSGGTGEELSGDAAALQAAALMSAITAGEFLVHDDSGGGLAPGDAEGANV